MRSSICEKIRKQAKALSLAGKPSFLVHVSKKIMADVTYEFYGDSRPDTARLELAWLPDNIVVEKTMYITGIEWSDVTKTQYESWNKK